LRGRRARTPPKKHGALWSIIYIDLMTQIMAFFIILWAVQQRQERVKAAVVQHGLGIGNQTVRMVDLPGDVLFSSGKTELSPDGKAALAKLFGDTSSGVLSFDQGGLAERKLVIHGHTDDVGSKADNFALGYQRAWSVYQAIAGYSAELANHVVICTHADNSPAAPLPPIETTLTEDEKAVIREARAKNRRITIEDLVTQPGAE
jgi:outer membrane protein OmpA-like peptidoglycan-associated protein